jgi:hypothetical protein
MYFFSFLQDIFTTEVEDKKEMLSTTGISLGKYTVKKGYPFSRLQSGCR